MKVTLFGHEHSFKVRVEIRESTYPFRAYPRRYFTDNAALQAYLLEAEARLKPGEQIEVWPVKELMTVLRRSDK